MRRVSSTPQVTSLRPIAVAAYGPTVLSSIGTGAVLPVLALTARDLGASVGTAAVIVSLLGVGMLVGDLPAGALAARFGERRALLAASLCGRRFRPKVVVSRRVAFEPGNHLFNRWKYNRPDCILCVSAEVFETLRRWGCNPEKMRVVHSAVDSSRLEAVPVSRRDFGIPSDVPLLVTAGALEPHKDHAMLLEAFALVRRHVHNACLTIAGDGRLRSNLEKQVQEMGLADSVKFLGYRSDAPSVIAAGDVYVSSSWSEGLGTSILEAMGMGVPVVATRAGGAGEMIIPGVTGWLVPARNARLLADALVECLQHREQAAQMAANARLLARGYYSADRMARHTLSAYGGLLGKPIAGADPAPCSDPYEWLRQQGIEVNAGCQPGKAR